MADKMVTVLWFDNNEARNAAEFYARTFPDSSVGKKIASATGGKYFRATDTETLDSIYREIDRLEKTKVESRHFVDYRELAVQSTNVHGWKLPPLVLIALGLLSARLVLTNTLFREFT